MADPQVPTAANGASHLSIGEVLALLLEEFPDVTISKIRFLESQGLIDPERTASGYRKFYADDVELLRCILREQRENYLPLKVIKDRIDSGEIDPTNENPRPRGIKNVSDPVEHPQPANHPSAGSRGAGDPSTGASDPSAGASERPTGAAVLFQRTDQPPAEQQPAAEPGPGSVAATVDDVPGAPPADAPTMPSSAHGAVLPGLLLSFDELCAMAGLSREQLGELRSYGVVVGTSSKGDEPFDEDAVEIATICKRFLDAGIEARHLRGWRVAADREVGLLEQLIQPLLRQRNPEARAQAFAQLTDLEATGGRLRSALMRAALRRHGG